MRLTMFRSDVARRWSAPFIDATAETDSSDTPNSANSFAIRRRAAGRGTDRLLAQAFRAGNETLRRRDSASWVRPESRKSRIICSAKVMPV